MKLIHFFSEKKYLGLGQPEPTKKSIPEWYRKAESEYDLDGQPSAGLKKCMPYMDTLVSGYLLKTPVNIYVKQIKNKSGVDFSGSGKSNISITWDGPSSLQGFIQERPADLGATMPRPAGHHENHLVFQGFWGIKTPRGWSTLMTHPLNRFDLPFTTTSGIVDSDKFFAPGNVPFFIKEGFEGMIPKGTPFLQLIPIKRADWKMVKNNKGLSDMNKIQGQWVRAKGFEYKKIMWDRKKYD
jgi:hypothetical protein